MVFKYIITIGLLFVITKSSKGDVNDNLTIETAAGRIRGIAAADGNYSMFMGIPYGQVDNDNPFGPSTPYPKFENIFEANDDSSSCPQVNEFSGSVVGSLDCLRLNIYVPNNADQKLPVIVLIHGGSYSTGSGGRSIFGPRFLVEHDIIFVTLNYRLGPYGFMCLHTPRVPGNQGLKDQLLALRWIKQNIEAFGGDANKITIAGESAGARSVDLHLQSPQEKLFDKAIIQSGSSFNHGWFPEPDLRAPIKLASALNYSTDNVDEALAFLSHVHPHSVIAAQTGITFRLCVEKDFPNTEKFITDHPLNIDVPKAAGMPILIGYANQELIPAFANQNQNFFDTLNIFYDQLKNAFNFDNQTLTELERIVRNFYIGDEKISEQVRLEIADFASDFTYIYSTHRNIDRYLKNGANGIYQYVFSYIGQRNFNRRNTNVNIGGAAHVDDRGYLYDIQLFPEEPTMEDQQVLDRMTTMWTNFAKYDDPTPATTHLIRTRWIPITKDSQYHYMEIGSELKTGMRHYHKRMSFWKLFYTTYAELESRITISSYSSSKAPTSISLIVSTICFIVVSVLHL